MSKNLLANHSPHLRAEWDLEENEQSFDELTYGSSYQASWLCDLGHKWTAKVANRTKNGQGCPYCSNRRVLAGFNDLLSIAPEVASQWDYSRNPKRPEEVTLASHFRAAWVCSLGHRWRATVANRTNGATGCPYCSGNLLLTGFNDFATLFPEVLSRWDWANNTVSPSEIRLSYSKSVNWLCPSCGLQWRRKPEIEARRRPDACYRCHKGVSSFELDVRDVLKENLIFSSKDIIPPYEIDVYDPAKKRAIEINGEYWHSDYNLAKRGFASASEYHAMKLKLCREEGVELAFLWSTDWELARDEMKIAIVDFLGGGSPDPRLQRLHGLHPYRPIAKSS